MEEPVKVYWKGNSSPTKYHESVETSCPVCYEEFDDIGHIPRNLRNCSHLICHCCVDQMGSHPAHRAFEKNSSSLKCPICKQKGRPSLSGAMEPGDRLALAIVGAVKEIGFLGKRLSTGATGFSFAKIPR